MSYVDYDSFKEYTSIFNDHLKRYSTQTDLVEKLKQRVLSLIKEVKELKENDANVKCNLNKLEKKVDSIETNFEDGNNLQTKCSNCEQSMSSLFTKMDSFEKKVDTLEVSTRIIDTKINKQVENKLGEMKQSFSKNEISLLKIDEMQSENVKLQTNIKEIADKINSLYSEYLKIRNLSSNLQKLPTGTERTYKCEKCDSTFNSKKTLNSHIEANHPVSVKCHNCETNFEVMLDLEKHISKQHNIKGFKCQECNAEFYSKWRLQKHENSHQSEIKINCHYFNSDKKCPFAEIGCKFVHEYSAKCKFGSKCNFDRCQFRHTKTEE